MTRFLVGLFAAISTACSPVNVLNSLVPKDGYLINKDIPYGSLNRQKLDVYIPKNNDNQLLPVVIFLYGGGWDSGQKKDYLFVGEAFSSKGFLTVIPDYRVFPEVTFPDFMVDPANTVAWVNREIKGYGGDPENVFVVGHSAGAHITLMLNLNSDYLDSVNMKPEQLRSFVGIAGPYDFLPLKSKRLNDIFGPESSRWKSQPINYVSGKNQPTLLLVGLKDVTVWPKNTMNLANAIEDKNGKVDVIKYPDYGHVDMIAKIAKPFRGNSNLLNDIVQFMRTKLNSHHSKL